MSDEHDDEQSAEERRKRAERLRRTIKEGVARGGPPSSPREFTDRAASEAAEQNEDEASGSEKCED